MLLRMWGECASPFTVRMISPTAMHHTRCILAWCGHRATVRIFRGRRKGARTTIPCHAGRGLPPKHGDDLPNCHAPYAVHAGLVWPPRIRLHILVPQGGSAHRHPLPCEQAASPPAPLWRRGRHEPHAVTQAPPT